MLDIMEHSDLPHVQSSLGKETYQFSIALKWGKQGACLYKVLQCVIFMVWLLRDCLTHVEYLLSLT